MKAPDKIYCGNNGQGNLSYSSQPFIDAKEYIRKDALLEWVKEQKARLKQGYKKDWKNDDTLNGGRLMLDRLINKLNSM